MLGLKRIFYPAIIININPFGEIKKFKPQKDIDFSQINRPLPVIHSHHFFPAFFFWRIVSILFDDSLFSLFARKPTPEPTS